MNERLESWLRIASKDSAVVIAAFLLAMTGVLFSEKIQVGGGFGWDGVTYGEMAKDFYRETYETPIDAYRIQRILPPCLVHFGLRLFGYELSDGNVIRGFGILNVFCITLLAWCWCRIVRAMAISVPGKWLGFCGLFVNYAVAKHAAYYPVLTDIPAMAIGGAMICCYLESRRTPLLILSAFGAFTWPTLLGQGVLLALFPRESDREFHLAAAPWRSNLIFASLAAYYFVIILVAIKRVRPDTIWAGIVPMKSVIWLSMTIAVIFLFLVVYRLTDWNWPFDLQKILKISNWQNWLLVFGFAFAVKSLQGLWATKQSILAPQTYVLLIGLWSTAKPAAFFLAQIIYYGPCILLVAFLWKSICRQIHCYGLGLSLVMLFCSANGLDSESRHLMNFVPAMVTLVVKATESLHWTKWQYAFLAALSVLFSKCWFTINIGPMVGNAFEWPDQRYMMSFGPYMSDGMYLLQGSIALIAAATMYWICIPHDSVNREKINHCENDNPRRETVPASHSIT